MNRDSDQKSGPSDAAKPHGDSKLLPCDAIEEQIVAFLGRDATASSEKIAKAIGVSSSSVRRRLRRLRKAGLFQAQTPFRAVVEIEFDAAALKKSEYYRRQEEFCVYLTEWFEKFPHSKECEAVATQVKIEQAHVLLGGRSDIILLIQASSQRALADFVTHCLRQLPGVEKTTTSIISAPTPDDSSVVAKQIQEKGRMYVP